jgi:hypothetical protein
MNEQRFDITYDGLRAIVATHGPWGRGYSIEEVAERLCGRSAHLGVHIGPAVESALTTLGVVIAGRMLCEDRILGLTTASDHCCRDHASAAP